MPKHPQTTSLSLAVLALALSAGCASGPSQFSLRRGEIIRGEASCTACECEEIKPEPAAPAPSVVSAPVTLPPPPPAPAVVVTPPPPPPAALPPPPPPAPMVQPGISAQRDGSVVQLSWTLPESPSGYKAIEIMRNTRDQAAGRGRVRALRASVTQIEDNVPDSQANYWYWLKVTHADGTVQNFGPAAASSPSY